VFPATREQRCWVHKTVNVLDAMPKSAQPGAKKAIRDVHYAEERDHAEVKELPAFFDLLRTRPARRTPRRRVRR
jgi:transposase-like protein